MKGLGLLLLTLDEKIIYDGCQVHTTDLAHLTTLETIPRNVIAQKEHDLTYNATGEE